VPTISLDTVYRSLWMFTDLGLLTTLGTPRDRLRFDTNLAPHHHFVCTRCGKTEDFFSDAYDSVSIPREVRALGNVVETHVELRGVCKRCAESSS
jgi:Fur family peroxide stress response transcriptional regulator